MGSNSRDGTLGIGCRWLQQLTGRRSINGPPAFRAACGHPGANVTARKVPVTIAHADCDLTGVTIFSPGRGGATVPRISGTVGTSSGLTVTVHTGTFDVTVNATGAPGNA